MTKEYRLSLSSNFGSQTKMEFGEDPARALFPESLRTLPVGLVASTSCLALGKAEHLIAFYFTPAPGLEMLITVLRGWLCR